MVMTMTMKVGQGLAVPVMALPGVVHTPAPGQDKKCAACVLLVVATRAAKRLVIGLGFCSRSTVSLTP